MERLLVDAVTLRRLTQVDVPALVAFYNGLSAPSKRTFAPLGPITTQERCTGVAYDNVIDAGHDLVAVHEGRIMGWTFIWAPIIIFIPSLMAFVFLPFAEKIVATRFHPGGHKIEKST